ARAGQARHRRRKRRGDRAAAPRSGGDGDRWSRQGDRGESRFRQEPQTRRELPGVDRATEGDLVMRDPTIAKNYAEALIELARKGGGDLAKWGDLIDEV